MCYTRLKILILPNAPESEDEMIQKILKGIKRLLINWCLLIILAMDVIWLMGTDAQTAFKTFWPGNMWLAIGITFLFTLPSLVWSIKGLDLHDQDDDEDDEDQSD